MAVILVNGQGTPHPVEIDANGRMHVLSFTAPEEHHENQDRLRQWTVPFDAIDPTDSTGLFLALENTSEETRAVSKISITSTIAGFVQFAVLTGAIGAGTTIAPLSGTIGGPIPAKFSAQSGVALTGLTLGGIHHHIFLQANVERDVEFPATVRMLQNTLVGLRASTTGIFTGNINFYEED